MNRNGSVCVKLFREVWVKLLAFHRIMILQKEKEELSEQHEQATQKLQVKYETDLSHLHHEHALSAAKVHITTAHSHVSPSAC